MGNAKQVLKNPLFECTHIICICSTAFHWPREAQKGEHCATGVVWPGDTNPPLLSKLLSESGSVISLLVSQHTARPLEAVSMCLTNE